MIYGSETWLITPRIRRVLGRFHYRGDRRLMGRQPQIRQDSGWLYPLMEEAMAESGLQELEAYISCHQSTAAQLIATRPIVYLCLAAAGRTGSRVSKLWWDQEGLDLEGMWMTAWEGKRMDREK